MSITDEILDVLEPLPNPFTNSLMEEILKDKKGTPSKYASHWEMDEEDVDEATEEEIQNNPAIKMLWAAEHGKLDIVEELTSQDEQLVHSKDKDEYTSLHRAAYNNHIEVAEFLLNHSADKEAQTTDGWTPLHSAANWGNYRLALLLLQAGANVNAQTKGRQTPLHLAASNSDSEKMLQLLLMHPLVDYTLTNAMGETSKQIGQRNSKYHYLFDMVEYG